VLQNKNDLSRVKSFPALNSQQVRINFVLTIP